MSRDDLINVANPRAKEKQRRPRDCCQSKIEAASEGKKTNDRISQAGEANLLLERAVRPTDKACSHLAQKTMQHEVIEKTEPDGEK